MASFFRFLFGAWLCALYLTGYSANLPEGFAQVLIADGLNPTTMSLAPDGRIYIAEKDGHVLIVEDDQLLPDPFLSLTVDDFNERGLGGIAFHPDFEQNHFFYVYYTVSGANHNRVSRFTANGDFAVLGSEVVLLDMDPLNGAIHNGGAMFFGNDGMLYIATGDGAFGGNAQNPNNLLGKILRIHPDGSIPTDNPFYNQYSGKYRSIYAEGLRNPFTMAYDPVRNFIFANDVGSDQFEEVNHIKAGKDYGWDWTEGPAGGNLPADYENPLYAYGRSIGCSVIGASFYRPEIPMFPPNYLGKYFFGDYCEGYIKVMNPDNGQIEETFATDINRPLAILTHPDGAIYYIERAGIGGGSPSDNTGTTNAALWKIVYTGNGAPFISVPPKDVLLPIGESASFSVIVSGADVQYQWQKNGLDIPNATHPDLDFGPVDLSDDASQFRCIVWNNEGADTSDVALLSVTENTRPVPSIILPQIGQTYQAGDTLFFQGIATDLEDGALLDNQLTWWIDFHHDSHTHPGLTPLSGTEQGYYEIPRIGEIDDNVWYRVYLRAEDLEGLAQVTYKEVFPEKSTISVESDPPGLKLNLDGREFETPYSFPSVVGILRSIKAPLYQEKDNQAWLFDHWEDGNTGFLQDYYVPEEGTSFKAVYKKLDIGIGTGLLGSYYHWDGGEIEGIPVFSRLDGPIDFNWDLGQPDNDRVGPDNFAVRWSGSVLPLLSGWHTFSVLTDDGVRLWVNDSLIIDRWIPQPATESKGSLQLEAGIYYPIRLEYFEAGGHALASLSWQSPLFPNEIIPVSQLFPAENISFGVDQTILKLFPNPTETELTVRVFVHEPKRVSLSLIDMQGRQLYQEELEVQPYFGQSVWDLSDLSAGLYILRLRSGDFVSQKKFIKIGTP